VRFFTLPLIIILGFVAYRLSRLIAHDAIAEPFRKRVYASQAYLGRAGKWLNTLTTCPFCLSVWFTFAGVGWVTWMILPTWPGWGEFLLAIPAAAGVAAILAASDLALTTYVEKHDP
jgi:hypothetical protein